LLDQIERPLASFTGDGAYDQDGVYRVIIDHDPDAVVVVPPRATAVLSETAGTAPTQRDQHLQCIADKGRIGWQRYRATPNAAGWKSPSDASVVQGSGVCTQ
jgi:hypothetical protein